MPLFADRSHKALAGLGRKSVESAARSTLEVALSHMEAAVKKVSLERGHDPRDFALVAFGGAGPMHACELAARLEIPRVLVPLYPGLFSSMGMLLASPGRDYTRSLIRVLDEECIRTMAALFEELESAAALEMSHEGFTSGLRFARSLAMRYRGQSHEVSVPAADLALSELERHFEAAYQAAFGYLRQGHDVEVINVKLACRAPRPELPLAPESGGSRRAPQPLYTREIFFEKRASGPVFSRRELSSSHPVTGPALIFQEDTTTVVPPGWRASADVMGNLDIEVAR